MQRGDSESCPKKQFHFEELLLTPPNVTNTTLSQLWVPRAQELYCHEFPRQALPKAVLCT